ncbi:MAG: hypothetical protein ACRDNP_13870 [Gaiellaceae bacterium]
MLGRRHLEQVLRIYVQHYNSERPHRGLALRSPEPPSLKRSSGGDVQRCDRRGGRPPRVLQSCSLSKA